jgi:hypothetical protein
MPGINIDMVLVSEISLAVLFNPTGIGIFLTLLIFAPVFGNLALFYSLILISAVTLFWICYYTGIDYLSFFSRKAALAEKFIKLRKKIFDKLSPNFMLSGIGWAGGRVLGLFGNINRSPNHLLN